MKYTIFCLLIILSACSSSRVITAETANADFSKYKTFDFYHVEGTGDIISENAKDNLNVLETAIINQMNKRGYLQTKINPDLWINIGIAVKEKIQTRQTDFRTDAPRYLGQRNYSWKSTEIETGRYREGTVTVHVVDAAQNKMVWRGILEGIIPDNPLKVKDAVDNGMQKLFTQYPVAIFQK